METARGRRWPFAARDTEFTQLTAEDAHSVVLIGEPGAGKTRLLAELAAHLDTADRRVIHVGATSSLASVPFGAFAGVLSIGFEEGSPFETLVRALDALTGGRPEDLVLAVDDAHLLDDASAGLVLLAARAGSRILATAREREPSPDAITRLWKDDFAQRIDLQLLDEERVGVLLHAALRGPLDSHSLYRLHDVTRGNLLFIRELVDRAVDNGSLVERDGIWSWTVALIDAPSVHDLARERLSSVPAETMTLVESLAVGEPFGLAVVDRLCEPGALAAGEAAGLVVWREAGSRRELRLVHPLYAEVIRDAMGVAGRANRSAAVAEALASTGARRRDDRLRVAVLCLDAGTPGDPAELRAAALQAVGRADLGLADRLARAALHADGSAASKLIFGNVLYWKGDYEELVRLLGGDLPASATPAEIVDADLLVASSLYWGLDRLVEANERISDGIERAGYPTCIELTALRSQILFFAGRAPESIAIGRSVLDDPLAGPVARCRAYGGVLPSLACCGRLEQVNAELPAAMDLTLSVGEGPAMYSLSSVMVSSFLSQLFGGGLEQVDLLVGGLHAESVRRMEDPFRGVWSFVLGRSALAQGRISEALARLRDSTALARARDPGGILPWSLASLAMALGIAGDGGAATETMRQLDAARMRGMHHIDVDIELARAWTANARGELTQARAFAEKAGRSMLEDGRIVLGAYALHDALRLGADSATVVCDLVDAAASCDGLLAEAFAAHAVALSERDIDGLLAASSIFETAGWLLHAAECAACASGVAAEEGLKARQRDAAVIAAKLRLCCAPVSTPMLGRVEARASINALTKREQEVATMAARGMSKREMANALVISVRTVGNHINHVYGKLGIASRDELRAIFESES